MYIFLLLLINEGHEILIVVITVTFMKYYRLYMDTIYENL